MTQADLPPQPVLLGSMSSAPLECHCRSHAPAQATGHKTQAGALSKGQREWNDQAGERESAGEGRMSPQRPEAGAGRQRAFSPEEVRERI